MNIIFLHGCRQNSQIYMKIMDNYIKKIMKSGSKVYGLDGPFDYNGELDDDVDQQIMTNQKMWFETRLRLENIGLDDVPHDQINFTLDYLQKEIELHDIDILIGFSQGGNLIDTYLRLRNLDFRIKRVIILNGYTFPRYRGLIPNVELCIIVTSKNDEIVPMDKLHNNYSKSLFFEHEKGHKIKTNSTFIRDIVDSLLSN